MRHKIAGNKLGRHSAWREATIRDLAKATLQRERICTTKAKAKEARKLVDKLITLGKKGELAHKRRAFAILCDHKLVSQLFQKTAPRFQGRKGGYTRIIPLGNRRGDNADLAFLELTEKSEIIVSPSKTAGAAKLKAQQTVESAPPTSEKSKTAPAKDRTRPKPVKEKEPKGGKNFMGGFKKMFRRKQTDS